MARVKVVRRITYEGPEEAVQVWMQYSAPVGVIVVSRRDGATITVEHESGPEFVSAGSKWGGPRPAPERMGDEEAGQ